MVKLMSYLLVLFFLVVLAAGCQPPPATNPILPPALSPMPPPKVPGALMTPGVKAPPPPALTPLATPGTPLTSAGIPYYQGKTIEVLVSSGVGGSTDAHARAVAAFLPQYLPGNPRMILRNLPGGGGSVAMNSFFEKARPDGLTLIGSGTTVLSNQKLGLDIVHYDLRKVRFIDSIDGPNSLLFIRKDALPRLLDPRAKPVVIGEKEGTVTWMGMPMWGKEFLGWNVRLILGYGSLAESELALRKGEIEMFGTSDANIVERLKADGLIEVIVQQGSLEKGKWVPRPDYPEVPLFPNLLEEKGVKGLAWEAYIGWIGASLAVKNWLGAPPGTPDYVVSLIIDSFKKMARDPKFDALVKKTLAPIYSITYGDEILPAVKQLMDIPPEANEYGLQLQRKFGIVR